MVKIDDEDKEQDQILSNTNSREGHDTRLSYENETAKSSMNDQKLFWNLICQAE